MRSLTHFAHAFFQPRRLEKIASLLWPVTGGLWFVCFAVGSYYALVSSPPDYQQGDMVRFLYVHVPASWFALFTYTLMAFFSFAGYVAKIPMAHLLTKSLAIPGAVLTLISLVTGSLWGKPVWGTYWVWDARLTSMLILFFIYVGYISLAYDIRTTLKMLERYSILVMVGFVNIPIIKWSVDFWFTLHQPPSIMRLAKPAIDASFWPPLLWMTGAYFFFLLSILSLVFMHQVTIYRQQNTRQKKNANAHINESKEAA